jgi:TIGR00299 family protein
MEDIAHVIDALPLSETVRHNALDVYRLIADAEAQAHGRPVSEIHFHEVGTMDAIADVTAVCQLMEILDVQRVLASPVHVGCGKVRCAHGVLPVPAPATAFILKDVPIYGGRIEGELCTPTGAALLKKFVSSFGEMPPMKVEKIGYGMGKKDFEVANCVRAMLAETVGDGDMIVELSCNLDDMTPERIGFAMDCLFAAGALEVYTIPVGMKKSRPGVMLCVICKEADKDRMVKLVFRHTTTLGIRENRSRRYTLQRNIKTLDTPFGDVRVKYSEGYDVSREKVEYDDLARIALEKGIGIDEALKLLEQYLSKRSEA